MSKKKYGGVVIPCITPLTGAFALDCSAGERLLQFLDAEGAHPFLLGTTGEAPSLPLAVKLEWIRLAASVRSDTAQVYVGISSQVREESLELAAAAAEAGADVVVATLPGYYALDEAAMFHYFDDLASSLPLPLMIYNIPATTHMSIPLPVVDQLSQHPNIVGLKDSERSDERLQQSIQLWSGRSDFSHLLGWAARSAEALLGGSDGLVPSTGNFHPALYRKLAQAAKSGDREEALRLQAFSDELGDLYQKGRNLGQSLWALKCVMKQEGLCEAVVMPPLMPGMPEEEAAIRDQWTNLKTTLKI